MMDISEYGDVELTSAERTAFTHLSDNKDFQTLIDVMQRWTMKRAYDLIAAPHEGQDVELVQNQGGFQMLKRMTQYVFGSEDVTEGKKKP